MAPSSRIVLVGIGLAAALQAVFHLALARILGPAEYSLLAASLTIVLIATPSTLALQSAVAREISWRLQREGEAVVGVVLRDMLRALLRRLAALFAALLPFGIAVAFLVDVQNPLPVIATLAILAGMLMFSLAWGGLQGTDRLARLSAAQCWFAGTKLAAGVSLALLGLGSSAVIVGVAVATWATVFLSAIPLRRVLEHGRSLPGQPRRILRGFAGGPAAVLTLFAALSSMGVLVARISFTPHISGAYAAVSIGAYSLFVVVLAISTLLVPRITALQDHRRARTQLLRGVIAVTVLGVIGTATLYAFPEEIVRLAFGREYVFAADWLGPLGIAMTLFAISNVYCYHFLSLGQSQYTLLLAILLVIEATLYAFFHATPEDLIGVLIAAGGLLLIASELFDRTLRKRGFLRRDSQIQRQFEPLASTQPIRDLSNLEDDLTIVIPAYDEASRIESTLRDTASCIDGFGCAYEILIVDDGSRDATREVSERVARELDCVRVIGYERNAGKGFAIAQGAKAARGGLVLFLDADLEVHPRQLEILYSVMQQAQADVVIGSKLHRSSQVEYPRKRRIMSWGYYAIVRSTFGLPVRDTQTGLKLFRKEVLDSVVPRMLIKRFAFDLEGLVIAHRLGFRIVEAPVVVTRERDLPKIGWIDAMHTAWDTAAVWYRTYLRRYYDRMYDHEAKTLPSQIEDATGTPTGHDLNST